MQRLEPPMSLTDLDEKLTEKANKQSVAQALHRKVNKADLDISMAKKVDFDDLSRVLESKADMAQLSNLQRLLDFKADKHEVAAA